MSQTKVELDLDGKIGSTITTADNTDTLTLVSTDADANVGPNLNMYRNSASPADSDHGGEIAFNAKNDAGEIIKYGKIRLQTDDVSDGAETGRFDISTMFAGSEISRFMIKSDEIVVNQNGVDFDFRVEADSNANAFTVDAGAISGNGAVGVGAVNTSRTFNVTTPSSYSQYAVSIINASSSAPYGLLLDYSGAAPDSGSDYYFANFIDSSTARFRIMSDGDVVNHDNSYGSISDERIKQDITDANSQWDDIKALKVRNFKMKDDIRQHGADKSSLRIGLIAQEVESISPKLVEETRPEPSDVLSSSEFGTLYEDGDTIPEGSEIGDVKEVKEKVKRIKYSVLYMKAIKALQEAMARIEALEAK
jgi:hypothetical protein|tara:strand:+ start:43 stop:1134 length:1092 start_codon:yes stop_codon:yes gene_type:complete